jgi:hypothetical protein
MYYISWLISILTLAAYTNRSEASSTGSGPKSNELILQAAHGGYDDPPATLAVVEGISFSPLV